MVRTLGVCSTPPNQVNGVVLGNDRFPCRRRTARDGQEGFIAKLCRFTLGRRNRLQ